MPHAFYARHRAKGEHMDKLKMHSPDMTQQNIEKIQALFPNCVTESRGANGELKLAIDFDQLKQELSNSIVEGPQERYQLNWPGKREALLTANAPIAKTLRPCREESVNFDTTENLFIEGDNLDALKLLQEPYLDKIKMIYIDPPYNRGEDLIYIDDFTDNVESYLISSNQVDDSGKRLIANSESNGRFHSDWLTNIYMRLKLARNLLSDDGVIFISIDDNEVHNLRKLCDEVFGEDNALVPLIWSLPRGINAGHISRAHEYILVYAKNKSSLPLFQKVGDETFSVERCNKKIDRRHPASEITFPPGMRYEGQDKTITGKIEGSEAIEIKGELVFESGKLAKEVTLSAGWTMKNMILAWLRGEEVFDSKGQKIVEFYFKENGKLYSKKKVEFESPKSILAGVPDTQAARLEIEDLLGSQDVFPYPKPTELIRKLISMTVKSGDTVLDFFSGSGSTAHAVFKELINKKIRFISIQIPEVINDSNVDNFVALEFCEKLGVPNNIAEISKERIRRAGKSIAKSYKRNLDDLDFGFRVLKVDSSNMADVYYSPDQVSQGSLDLLVDNIKADRTDEDLLFQVLLDWGGDLTLPIRTETIQGKTVFFVDDDALVACFDLRINEALIKELATKEPLRVVFRDDGFESDAVKINAEQIFKQMSPHTEVKAI